MLINPSPIVVSIFLFMLDARSPKPAPLLEPVTDARVRKRMLQLMKVLYFLNGFSGSSFGRFATLFYLSPPRSLDAHSIGLIEAVQPVANAVGNSLFGWIADMIQRKKLVTLSSRAITTVAITTTDPAWGRVVQHSPLPGRRLL